MPPALDSHHPFALGLWHQGERPTHCAQLHEGPPSEAVVQVEYSPRIDGDPDPGEVVWTWVPYQDDPNRGKDRPVVIIGRTGDDLAGVPLTSKGKRRGDHVPVGSGSWDRRGRPTRTRCCGCAT